MPADHTTPTGDQVSEIWAAYRVVNFIPFGTSNVWVWCAAHQMDFLSVGAHLREVPGVRFDIGSRTFALMAFEAIHLVPLTSVKPGSMQAIAVALLTPLEALQERLRADQQAAQAEFERLVNARYSVKFPMVDAHGQRAH